MSLRVALVLTGDAEGAKKALGETGAAIDQLAAKTAATGKAAVDAGKGFEWNDAPAIGKLRGEVEQTGTSLKGIAVDAPAAGAGIEEAGRRAAGAIAGFINLKGALLAFGTGFLTGALAGGLARVFETATGAAAAFALEIFDDTPRIERNLKSHADLVTRIKQAYGEAEGAAASYGSNSVQLLRFEAQQNAKRLEGDYRDQQPDFNAFGGGGLNSGVLSHYGGGGPFAQSIAQLRKDVAAGKSDIIAFRNAIAAIAENLPTGDRFRVLATAIIESTDAAAKSQAEWLRSQDILKGLQGDADAAATALGGNADKYRAVSEASVQAAGGINASSQALGELELKAANTNQKLAQTSQLLNSINSGADGARGVENIFARIYGYVTGSGATPAPRGFAQGGFTGAGSDSDPAGIVHRGEYVVPAPAVRRIGVRNLAALTGIGIAGFATGGAVGGGSVSAGARATSFGGFSGDLAAMREAMLAQSPQLIAAYSAEERALQQIGTAAAGSFGAFVKGGEEAEQAAIGLLRQLALMVAQTALLGVFGQQAGGFAGQIFSSLFGGFRETGGDVAAGRAYVVGEKRPELFVPGRSGSIVPFVPQAANAGNGGSMAIRIELSEGLEARILSQAGSQAVELVRAATPGIASAGSAKARADYSRQRWGQQ